MGDWGRIHREFDQHPKVLQCDNSAIGLWTKCNAWSRRNRTAGFIPAEVAAAFATNGNIDQLCGSKLWERVEGGFRFKDWSNWNPDEEPKTAAAKLVHVCVSQDHPSVVRQQLVMKVVELMDEGSDVSTLTAALKAWNTRPGVSPSLLPHLVSDALRKRRGNELLQIIRDCWTSGDVTPLRRHGYWFKEPEDIPVGISVEEMRAFLLRHKRAWLELIQRELK